MMGIQIRLQQLFLMKIRKCSEILSSVHVIPLYHCKLNMRKCDSSQASYIRRPESACSSNNFLQNPNRAYFPRSKIQDPKPRIRNPKSMIQEPKNPKSQIQNKNPKLKILPGAIDLPHKERILPQSQIPNPKSKTQEPTSKIQDPKPQIQDPSPKSKIQISPLDFGFWIWDGAARAMQEVWPSRPPVFGLVGGR